VVHVYAQNVVLKFPIKKACHAKTNVVPNAARNCCEKDLGITVYLWPKPLM